MKTNPHIFGITGWSGSGKTHLVVRLIPELRRRGFRVSTVKHAHHTFDVDQPGKDSFEHRAAGASERPGALNECDDADIAVKYEAHEHDERDDADIVLGELGAAGVLEAEEGVRPRAGQRHVAQVEHDERED